MERESIEYEQGLTENMEVGLISVPQRQWESRRYAPMDVNF